MNCPRCRTVALADQELEPSLAALYCPQCRGHWIKGFQYWKWLEQHGPDLPEKPRNETAFETPVDRGEQALICPDCGHILGRYQVGHDISFALDHCGHCGGIWFDGGEWEALKERSLHDNVHAVFSDVWQAKIRRQAQAKTHEENLREMIGDADLAEVQHIKSWLSAHPQRYAIYALLHPDHTL